MTGSPVEVVRLGPAGALGETERLAGVFVRAFAGSVVGSEWTTADYAESLASDSGEVGFQCRMALSLDGQVVGFAQGCTTVLEEDPGP